jgi:hypothetical protein
MHVVVVLVVDQEDVVVAVVVVVVEVHLVEIVAVAVDEINHLIVLFLFFIKLCFA